MNKIIVEFESGNDPLFNRLKYLSQQRSHAHNDEKLVITDNEKAIAKQHYEEAVSTLLGKLGWTDRAKELEGTLIYTMNEDEKSRNFGIIIPLIKRALVHYMMFLWCRMF
jgi:hypothetical protein